MFLLIPSVPTSPLLYSSSLHSTMFLLIQQTWLWKQSLICSFTFHNVSINTVTNSYPVSRNALFTFHNVSINTFSFPTADAVLHDFTFHNVSINTVYNFCSDHIRNLFTFHNVSINTRTTGRGCWGIRSLHSTMFLLILVAVPIPGQVSVLYIPQCFY